MAETHSLLGRSQVRPHAFAGHCFPVLLLLIISILSISLFLPKSDSPKTFNDDDVDDHIIPITEPEFIGRWSSLNQIQQASFFRLKANGPTQDQFYLIAAGSNGPTQDQLLTFLKSKSTQELNDLASTLVPLFFVKGSPNGGLGLSFTNGVWIDQSLPVKPSFKRVVDTAYKAALKRVDFEHKPDEVRSEVNSWAEKETNGRIKSILAPGSVNSQTKLLLANALYFKGDWQHKFDASGTKEYDFHLLNGRSVKTPSMTRDGLPALVERCSSESGFLDDHLRQKTVKVGAYLMPKFKFSSKFEASELLKTVGLKLPFVPGGLTEMVDSPIHVSHIQHESFIDVNEDGTEAAAVTVSNLVGSTLDNEKPIDFVADHPFFLSEKKQLDLYCSLEKSSIPVINEIS
ncbi:hypothetical protein ACLB2K_047771 [Fragaria x ananassa]